ncbi:MAG: hypothetical protein FJX29_04840 [Alphaproteobacteria bacterium]|nr:hypothetical protein [Alphaproteobacteria bacterium]
MAGRSETGSTIIWGFIAGALAVLVFHQLTILTLNGFRFSSVWQMTPAIPPFGVPRLLNQMFWGGAWGILLAAVAHKLPGGIGYYVAGFLFGAIVLSIGSWYLVPAVKSLLGQNVRFGPNPAGWWRGPLINGMWGLGAAIFLQMLWRRR